MLERMNAVAAMWLARIAAAVIACLALMTFADVFARYVFNSPFSFTIELTEAAMGVIVFFGLALVTHEDGHISVDIVTSRLRARLRAALGLLMQAIALAYLALLVWRLWIRALELYDFGDTTQILLMPLWPGAMLMAFGSLFLLTGVFLLLLRAMRRLTRGEPQI